MTKAKPTLGKERVSYSIHGLWRGDWVEYESGFSTPEAAAEYAKGHYFPEHGLRIVKVTSVDIAEVTR